jgi:lactoylglutathione lyase
MTNSEPLNGLGLGVSLTVKDIEKSLHWYNDVVGFTVDRRMERDGKLVGVVLTAGNVRMLLNQDDGAKGWDRVKGQGFSMSISIDQDIDALASRIKERGGKLESEPQDMPWGARAFRVYDPDGFQIAFNKWIR